MTATTESRIEIYRQVIAAAMSAGSTAIDAVDLIGLDKVSDVLDAVDWQDDFLSIVMIDAMREADDERTLGDAVELWLAGWASTRRNRSDYLADLQWTAPAPEGRKHGTIYKSTARALKALRKATHG